MRTLTKPDYWTRRADAKIALALAIFALFFRLATLMMIHTGVDERDYWFSAKAIALGLPYPELSHRTVRFAVILPVAGAQLVLGESPNVYYVLPVLNSMLQAALAYLIGSKARGRLAGLFASLGLILFPYMIRSASQVRPEVFSLTYVLAALWCFLAYLDDGKRRRLGLAGSALFFFAAYESKITNLFFLPGLLAVMLARKKPFRDIALFGGILLGLFLVETGLYAAFTEYRFGQLQVIERNHLEGNSALVAMGFLDLFKRYAEPYLQAYWQATFLLFAAAAVYYAAKKSEGAATGPRGRGDQLFRLRHLRREEPRSGRPDGALHQPLLLRRPRPRLPRPRLGVPGPGRAFPAFRDEEAEGDEAARLRRSAGQRGPRHSAPVQRRRIARGGEGIRALPRPPIRASARAQRALSRRSGQGLC